MIKSRKWRWAGHVVRMEEGRSTFKILTGTLTGKRHLGRSRSRWEENIRIANYIIVIINFVNIFSIIFVIFCILIGCTGFSCTINYLIKDGRNCFNVLCTYKIYN